MLPSHHLDHMCCTCDNVETMSKMIQIRNVPERPSRAELLARLQSRESVDVHSSITDLVAEERNQR